MDRELQKKITEYLGSFVTDHKKNRISQVIENRTNHITLVLEDIFQPHNASATIRTCECLGIQHIHIIENKYNYHINPDIVMGSSKWISLHQHKERNHNNTETCYQKLRENGYKIYATTPHQHSYTPTSLPLDEKAAIVFGTEETGLSDYALEHADGFVRLPMYGFTESFNISVTVAIVFSRLIERLHMTRLNWKLSQEEKEDLLLEWYRKIVRRSDLLEEEFINNLQS